MDLRRASRTLPTGSPSFTFALSATGDARGHVPIRGWPCGFRGGRGEAVAYGAFTAPGEGLNFHLLERRSPINFQVARSTFASGSALSQAWDTYTLPGESRVDGFPERSAPPAWEPPAAVCPRAALDAASIDSTSYGDIVSTSAIRDEATLLSGGRCGFGGMLLAACKWRGTMTS